MKDNIQATRSNAINEKKSLAKTKNKIEANKTSFKLSINTAIKKDIIPLITPNFSKQKTSYNLGNLYIESYQFRNCTFIMHFLYLLSSSFLRPTKRSQSLN